MANGAVRRIVPHNHLRAKHGRQEIDEQGGALRIKSKQNVTRICGRVLGDPPGIDVPVVAAGVRHTCIAIAPGMSRRCVN